MNTLLNGTESLEKNYRFVARVSDANQRKALPAQKLNLKSYAQRIEQPWDEKNYYQFDESAFKDNRSEFEELVRGFEKESKDRYLAIVFDKIDRFTRNSRQAIVNLMMRLVDDGRIELHFPSDGLVVDKNSSANDLMRFDIGLVLARYYSLATRDGVNRRFNQMLHDKEWISTVPLGYIHVKDPNNTRPRQNGKPPKKQIIFDESRRHHIVKMFDLRIAKYSYKEISNILYADGLRTKAGNKVSKSTIEHMLKNPFYCGIMRCKKRNFEGPHRHGAIVSKHVFDLTQAVGAPKRTGYRHYEFSRLAKCKNCGCQLTHYKTKGYSYFRCNQCENGCKNKNVSALPAINITNLTINNIHIPKDKLPEIVKRLQGRYDDDVKSQRKSQDGAREEYEKAKKALTNIGMKLAEDSITQDEYDNLANIYRAKMVDANELIRKSRTPANSFEITESYLLDLHRKLSGLYKNASDGLKNKLLQFITSNFTADGKDVEYEVTDLCKCFITLNKNSPNGANSEMWCG